MNFVWGFVGGILAWFATEFVGQPIKTFVAARSEAARVLAQFADLDEYDPVGERGDVSPEAAAERSKALSAAGAALVAFSHSNQYLVPAFHWLHLRPRNAGDALILLSKLKPRSSYHNELQHEEVMRYLRLGKRFGPHHRI
jgi:hypothetical protein